jgi:hypothetical protein
MAQDGDPEGDLDPQPTLPEAPQSSMFGLPEAHTADVTYDDEYVDAVDTEQDDLG